MSVEANENPTGEKIDEMPSSPSAKATLEPEELSGLEKPPTETSDPLADDKTPVEPENVFAEKDETDPLAFLEDPPIEPLPVPVKLVVQLPEPAASYNAELDEFLQKEPNNDLMSMFTGESLNVFSNQEMPSTSSNVTASDDADINHPPGSIYNPIQLD